MPGSRLMKTHPMRVAPAAKALMRSRLWSEQSRVPRRALPSMGRMINDQTGVNAPEETQEEMARRYAPDL